MPKCSGGTPALPSVSRFAHVPGLDGLRGLAVVAVLFFHGGRLRGGYLGVDLFFVLSGYLITSLLLYEYEREGRIDLRAFWGRRIRRLLPALFALLVAVAGYARWVARPIDYGDIRSDALATLGYVANWHTIFSGSSYWDISKAPSPLQHTWSLAIEEQFYILWPLAVVALIALASRRGRSLDRQRFEELILRVGLVGTGIAFMLFVGLHGAGASSTRLYEGTDTRSGAILIGVALAVWMKRRRDRSAPLSVGLEISGVAAAVALGLLWFLLDGESPWLYRGMLPVASVLGVVVIAAVADPRSPVLGRIMSLSPFRALGLISYGLYLWHWLIFRALELRNGRYPFDIDRTFPPDELFLVQLLVSLLVAMASYWFIENPVRRGLLPVNFRAPLLVGSLIIAMVLVLEMTRTSIAGPATGPSAERAEEQISGAPSVVFIGDSVAASLVRPIVKEPTAFGVNPINRTRIGCSEVSIDVDVVSFAGKPSDRINEPCGAQVGDAEIATLDADVFFVEIGSRPNDFLMINGKRVRSCEPEWDDVFRMRMGTLIDRLGSSGARVAVGNIPYSSRWSIPVDGDDDRIACLNELINELVADREFSNVIDLNGFVCPHGPKHCLEELEGGDVRSDGLHFDDGPGGFAVSKWVAERIVETAQR